MGGVLKQNILQSVQKGVHPPFLNRKNILKRLLFHKAPPPEKTKMTSSASEQPADATEDPHACPERCSSSVAFEALSVQAAVGADADQARPAVNEIGKDSVIAKLTKGLLDIRDAPAAPGTLSSVMALVLELGGQGHCRSTSGAGEAAYYKKSRTIYAEHIELVESTRRSVDALLFTLPLVYSGGDDATPYVVTAMTRDKDGTVNLTVETPVQGLVFTSGHGSEVFEEQENGNFALIAKAVPVAGATERGGLVLKYAVRGLQLDFANAKRKLGRGPSADVMRCWEEAKAHVLAGGAIEFEATLAYWRPRDEGKLSPMSMSATIFGPMAGYVEPKTSGAVRAYLKQAGGAIEKALRALTAGSMLAICVEDASFLADPASMTIAPGGGPPPFFDCSLSLSLSRTTSPI